MALSLTPGYTFANNELVTPAKLNTAQSGLVLSQATARLIGRTTAGAGAAEEISVGSNLSLSAGALNLATNLNSVNIGPTTPGTGAFTTLTASTSLAVTGTGSFTGGVGIGSTGTDDYIKLVGQTAGVGGAISSNTYDNTDYAKTTIVGYPVAIAARTTAGNSTTVATFSSTGLAVTGKTTTTTLNISSIPTSASGLSSGDVWSDGGTLKIVS
jgi:hypothetical protein